MMYTQTTSLRWHPALIGMGTALFAVVGVVGLAAWSQQSAPDNGAAAAPNPEVVPQTAEEPTGITGPVGEPAPSPQGPHPEIQEPQAPMPVGTPSTPAPTNAVPPRMGREASVPGRSAIPQRPAPVRPRPNAAKVGASPPSVPQPNIPAPDGPAAAAATAEDSKESLLKPHPYRPKGGKKQTEPFMLDLSDASLPEVVEALGAMIGKTFDLDPNLANQRVTIISFDEIPADMAYPLLESILTVRGFVMTPALDGNLIRIRQVGQDADKRPMVIGSKEAPKGYDTFYTYVVPVNYADAAELQSLLQVLGSDQGRVDVYGKTNTLIISDTADGIRRILDFLREIDIPGFDTEMEIFTLEYTRAEVLAQQIQDVLLGPEQTARTQGPPAPVAVPRPPSPGGPVRPGVPGRPQATIVGTQQEELRIVPDERLNALIVVASKGLMERVRDLVERLDTPTVYETGTMHIYELQYADAEKVADALNSLVGAAPASTGGSSGRSSGAPSGSGGGGAVSPMQVQAFQKEVSIAMYEETNALLIVASPQDYETLKGLIAQLDVPKRQVHIEAIIMNVRLTDDFQLSVEGLVSGRDGFLFNNVVNLANSLAGGPLNVAGRTNVFTAGQTYFGEEMEIEYITDAETGETARTRLPGVPLLLTALEIMTDVDVLAQPSLTTIDNVEASIVVGQDVPYVTGSQRSLDQMATPYSSVFSQVSRQDVGIKMQVKPQISEGDYILMELTVTDSTISDQPVANPEVVGPTLDKSEIKNNVVVKDGATGIIGGLIRESVSHARRRMPLLGELPLVGWMFGARGGQVPNRVKQNLVVLVTPHIVKEGVDMDRVTDYKLGEFRDANVDAMFEKGIIRRISKNYKARNKHRPALEKVNTLMRGEGLRRGNIEK